MSLWHLNTTTKMENKKNLLKLMKVYAYTFSILWLLALNKHKSGLAGLIMLLKKKIHGQPAQMISNNFVFFLLSRKNNKNNRFDWL